MAINFLLLKFSKIISLKTARNITFGQQVNLVQRVPLGTSPQEALTLLPHNHMTLIRVGRMAQWVKALYCESEGSWFKPHYALGQALGTNLFLRLPVTFGLNQESNAVINIGLLMLPPRQWPKVCLCAAKQHLKKCLGLQSQGLLLSNSGSKNNSLIKVHRAQRSN